MDVPARRKRCLTRFAASMTYHIEFAARAARDLEALYVEKNAAESEAASRWYNGLEALLGWGVAAVLLTLYAVIAYALYQRRVVKDSRCHSQPSSLRPQARRKRSRWQRRSKLMRQIREALKARRTVLEPLVEIVATTKRSSLTASKSRHHGSEAAVARVKTCQIATPSNCAVPNPLFR